MVSGEAPNPFCVGKPDGQFAMGGHCLPTYISCLQGAYSVQQCPRGQVFDGQSGQCRFDLVNCAYQTVTIPAAPIGCGENEAFTSCGSACEATCSDPNPQCQFQCVSSCQCRPRFVRQISGGPCVQKEFCYIKIQATTPPRPVHVQRREMQRQTRRSSGSDEMHPEILLVLERKSVHPHLSGRFSAC